MLALNNGDYISFDSNLYITCSGDILTLTDKYDINGDPLKDTAPTNEIKAIIVGGPNEADWLLVDDLDITATVEVN